MTERFSLSKILIVLAFFLSSSAFPQELQDKKNVTNGLEEYANGNFKKAEEEFTKSTGKNPEAFIPFFNLGASVYKQNLFERAASIYEEAVKKAKSDFEKSRAFYNQGNSYLKQNKLDESIESYKEALKLNPNDPDAKYNLSYALKKKQKEQEQKKDDQKKDDQKKDDQKKDDQKKDDQKKDDQKKDDQKKDDQKKDDQKKDDQKKDDQKKDDQKNDQKDKQNPENGEQNQPTDRDIKRRDYEGMLDALKNVEEKLQKDVRKIEAKRKKRTKDW